MPRLRLSYGTMDGAIGFLSGLMGMRSPTRRAAVRMMADARRMPHVDMNKVRVSYARSSGPGGQNVNKVETKVEMRLSLDDIDISESAMKRLQQIVVGRVNNAGELIVSNSETRSRKTNYDNCIKKITEFIDKAMIEPKDWNKNSKTADKFHRKRLEDKRRRSENKASRKRTGNFFSD
eukprot:Plantae.Rhodophyta-Purpureofilum_apyrenoidigerum.ctg27304.p1 GENE.Plantae.Rhodophyta-Purpureofilum_apyrenoidigerum.ctg27304~~Plantae.Rhodophyta-Purpureofilum_apyrenoidigerum.ctg27304.p1  ORF type:complete len:178 (+),score=46.06 Plantae.Rhodophyta-Purpureofilum_apyrenoidigerum.ctg27304:101-634(+)